MNDNIRCDRKATYDHQLIVYERFCEFFLFQKFLFFLWLMLDLKDIRLGIISIVCVIKNLQLCWGLFRVLFGLICPSACTLI
jgi:hypothetical protein